MIKHLLCTFLCATHFSCAAAAPQPVFDIHLHYTRSDAAALDPDQILAILQRNHVRHALVTGTPPEYAVALHEQAGDQIIPFLGVYQDNSDKESWYRDKALPGRVRRQLNYGHWQGIGELHLFAEQRHSPVLRQLVQLAAQHQLPLLMHADPAVIDTIYEIAPNITVLWAHAGTYPYPDLLADYLRRYPRLHIDLSVRTRRIAPGGQISEAWYQLFVTHPDRFVIGVDTFSTRRWHEYGTHLAAVRQWLAQLPLDISTRLASGNARRLFNITSRQHD